MLEPRQSARQWRLFGAAAPYHASHSEEEAEANLRLCEARLTQVIVTGSPPFSDSRSDNIPLRDQILKANYQFYPQLFDKVSDEAKDLIRKLLKVKLSEWLSAYEILQHPWMNDKRARTVKIF